jgi:hypothetical protein
VYVKIVGVNAGAGLLAQLNGAVALKMFIVGFSACSVRPSSSGLSVIACSRSTRPWQWVASLAHGRAGA